jgi:ATP/maltotriose-dependent transcriptional regulator MalT
VSFRYKKEIDPQSIPQFGLVAEDVEKVNPDLVIRDPEGKPYTVRYEQINAMLLNEFLKEHKTVQQQQAAIAELKSTVALQRKDFEAIAARQQKEIQTLIAGFTKQAGEIQRVSVHMELGNAGPGVVMNDPRRVKSNTSSQ